jgi:DNA-binding response OmpR family regulator
MMPGMDGFKTCSEIKKRCDVPIIFLTGRDSEEDKIGGLLLGADDYMIKPYSLRELEVRIQVLIRRYHATSTAVSGLLEYPPLSINRNTRKVYFEEQEIALSNKEYDLLCLLAASPNQVFTFEEIGNEIWNGYLESDRKTIMVTASRLRKKLAAYAGLPQFIETVWSQGYRFVIK